MSTIHYAVQIATNASAADTDEGLYQDGSDYYFRWITGRPDYDGVTVVPTGDNDGDIWKEGILLSEKQFSPTVQIIDVTIQGNYGTLSGFSFTRKNSGKFWNYLNTNSIYLINQTVKFFVIIDDVFYQRWQGVIIETPYDETSFKFICEDDFKTVHKTLPPAVISNTTFPKLNTKADGEAIPVCFGNINRAKLISVYENKTGLILYFDTTYEIGSGRRNVRIASLKNYSQGSKIIQLNTGLLPYSAGELAGNYIRVAIGGTNESLKITDNSEVQSSGGNTYINIYVDKWFDSPPQTENATDNGTTSLHIWYLEILTLKSTQIISNQEINSFELGVNGNIARLYFWDKDQDDYISAVESIDRTSKTNIGNVGYPGIEILNKGVNLDGEVREMLTIKPEFISCSYSNALGSFVSSTLITGGNDNPDLHDRDISSSYNHICKKNLGEGSLQAIYEFEMIIPEQLLNTVYENVYIVMDQDLLFEDDTDSISINYAFSAIDFADRETASIKNYDVYYFGRDSNLEAGITKEWNLIPKIYYNEVADDDTFNEKKIYIDIQEFIENNKAFQAFKKLKLTVTATVARAVNPEKQFTYTFREITFVAVKKISLTNQDAFTKIKGEEVSAVLTDNVYRGFQHILETYDGVASGNIDYDNLASKRAFWKIGRQVTDRKNSFEYLKELAEQTFTGIHTTIDGKKRITAFRDNTTSVATHDESKIIKGSLRRLTNTSISDIFNEFKIKFDYNPANDTFNRSLFITNVEQASFPSRFVSIGTDGTTHSGDLTAYWFFIYPDGLSQCMLTFSPAPSWATVDDYISFDAGGGIYFAFGRVVAIDGNDLMIEFENDAGIANAANGSSGTVYEHSKGVAKWQSEFVGGINDYATAANWWDVCHESYLRNRVVKSFEAECKWFPDNENFVEGSGGSGNAAYYYLQQLVEWTTRQKEKISYALPINSTNLALELLDHITFEDDIYTNAGNRVGWITKIKLNPANDLLEVEAILEPEDIIETGGLIIETGDAPDTITESGSETDTITEGA